MRSGGLSKLPSQSHSPGFESPPARLRQALQVQKQPNPGPSSVPCRQLMTRVPTDFRENVTTVGHFPGWLQEGVMAGRKACGACKMVQWVQELCHA